MDEQGIKTSQRVSRSCVECGRRKIRCDKKSPCQPCIRRNVAHECRRPIARVRGQLTMFGGTSETNVDVDTNSNPQVDLLLRERDALQARIAELETALALSKPCAHSHASASTDYTQQSTSLEDLIPSLEQFDIGIKPDTTALTVTEKEILNRLYEPATDPIFLLLPSRDASAQIVYFSLQTLGWLHCAVDADTFMNDHDDFWERTQLGVGIDRERRPWLTVYLALLAVGILYFDPCDVPDIAHLPQLGISISDPVDLAVHTSRIWYEAALKEIEKHGCSGTPSINVVQALSVLTLCHSNFGEHQREWLFTGFATNMARCLDMHKLGSEAACSPDIRRRQEWSTSSQRELGRRLWWACVIRDWLGSWSRPPSISPASFCCQFSTQETVDSNIVPTVRFPASPASAESIALATPSPAHYHSIMSRLAYIFYIYIKANTHHTTSKFAKAIEEIQVVQKTLPLHLSPSFPASENDMQWEVEHPWVPLQRYLLTHVIDFLQLGIARGLVSKEPRDDMAQFRKLALDSSTRILHNYAIQVPRVYRLIWTVSAATVAASIYISLDILANPHDYGREMSRKTVALLRNSATELRKHAVVAVHAAKGSAVIESLLPLLEAHCDHETQSPHSLHQLLKQLTSANQNKHLERPESLSHINNDGFFNVHGDSIMFAGVEDLLEPPFETEGWNDFLENF
ncbi:hypothetical protein BKA66DRAFT_591987 [Pyrenochaeta sp. MPI-SDFR-AT-0127]|nr:hypothetical protein BKA66DRAFT_591987 [Pyrenochaeta sp. MPI-SDFR-AT-0127]